MNLRVTTQFASLAYIREAIRFQQVIKTLHSPTHRRFINRLEAQIVIQLIRRYIRKPLLGVQKHNELNLTCVIHYKILLSVVMIVDRIRGPISPITEEIINLTIKNI